MLAYLRQNAATLLVCLFVVCLSVRSCNSAHQKVRVAQMVADTTARINDSTVARLAEARARNDSLQGLFKAAHALDGQLIAAVKLKIAKRDTLVIHDTLVTTTTSDSSRSAVVDDSTAWYRLQGTVTAPPCCAPLKFKYNLTRPAFEPSIGLVEKGDQVIATVVWQGEQVTVSEAFAKLRPKNPRLVPFAEAYVDPFGRVSAGAGVQFRLFWNLNVATTVRGPAGAFVGVGIRKEFR